MRAPSRSTRSRRTPRLELSGQALPDSRAAPLDSREPPDRAGRAAPLAQARAGRFRLRRASETASASRLLTRTRPSTARRRRPRDPELCVDTSLGQISAHLAPRDARSSPLRPRALQCATLTRILQASYTRHRLDTPPGVGQNFNSLEQTLLLNASYEPLKIVHWQKAVTLLCQGKVEGISVYDREI